MGISIHFRGKIARIEERSLFIEEMADIGRSMKWDVIEIMEPHIRGVVLSPTGECESLPFLINENGYLQPLAALIRPDLEWSDEETVSVKTQFAESEVHMWISSLLKYIKKTWIPALHVSDEAGFYETGDRTLLEKKRILLSSLIEQLTGELEKLPASDQSAEELESLVIDIVKRIRKSSPD